MQTRFSSFLNIRSPYVAPSESRRTELRHSSFAPISRLQMNLDQPLTNQPYGAYIPPHSRLHSSYVAQSLANQANTRPFYVRPNTSLAFRRYEQAINPPTINQPINQFAYSRVQPHVTRPTYISSTRSPAFRRYEQAISPPTVNQPINQFDYSRVQPHVNRPTYISSTRSAAFRRYEQAISPTATNQSSSRFMSSNSSTQSSVPSYSIRSAYATRSGNSSSSTMPVHAATPNLVKVLSQYKKLPDGEQNVKTTAKLNFLIALSRSWFLIRNKLKLPQSNNETKLKDDINLMLETAAACYKGKETGFEEEAENTFAPIFNQLDNILALMETHNIRFSEECLNRFVKSLSAEPLTPDPAPIPAVTPVIARPLPAPMPPIPAQHDPQADVLAQVAAPAIIFPIQADLPEPDQAGAAAQIDNLQLPAGATAQVAIPEGATAIDDHSQFTSMLLKYIDDYNGSMDRDLNRLNYDITINGRNVFSTSTVFMPTFTKIKLTHKEGARKESNTLDPLEYIRITKEQALAKLKNACSPLQYELVKQLACQNLVTLALNYEELIEKEGVENKSVIKDLLGLELGNIITSRININSDTETKTVTLNISFDNHAIAKDPNMAEKVKTLLGIIPLTPGQTHVATHEYQVNISLQIMHNGIVNCQKLEAIKGKQIIDLN